MGSQGRARLPACDARLCDRRDLVLGGRVEDVEASVIRGLAPFAAYPEIGRDIGEQIFVHVTSPLLNYAKRPRSPHERSDMREDTPGYRCAHPGYKAMSGR